MVCVSIVRLMAWSPQAKIIAACKECSQTLGARSGRQSKTLPGAAASDALKAIEVRSTALLNAARFIRETSLDSDRAAYSKIFL
jgi:hypothetical protein